MRGLRIGSLTVKNPVVSAPMAGISDKAFRVLAREMGCGLVWTEMISDQALVFGNRKTQELLDIEGEHPICVQLFGSKPETLSQAAEMAAGRGADMIDINMGCPTPKIVKNCGGAALMKEPDLAAEIVAAVVAAVRIPVTVKIRKGWDENHPGAVDFARMAVAAGASAVTVHGRFRGDFFSGTADWSVIRQVKEAVDVPVIGNGDVWTGPDAARMLEETGCDAVMIGRAARGNPWIYRDAVHFLRTGELLPPPTSEERVEMALHHFDILVRFKGEYTAVLEMRKHAAWYTRGMRGGARLRERLHAADTIGSMQELIRSVLVQQPV